MMEPRVAVLRMEGTNNEQDIKRAFEAAGASASYVHIKQLTKHAPSRLREEVLDYDVLAFPGGFSAGDYVRAGAIFASRLEAVCGDALEAFYEDRRPMVGICNGFQVLVELGLLPGENGAPRKGPGAALTMNENDRYECRPSLLRVEDSVCPFVEGYEEGGSVMFPSAHAEGRFVPGEGSSVDALLEEGRVVFRYVDREGRVDPGYPWNPNGSPGGIGGVTDASGTVLGLMPHPDRSVWGFQHPDWTRGLDPEERGDGLALFEGIVAYAGEA